MTYAVIYTDPTDTLQCEIRKYIADAREIAKNISIASPEHIIEIARVQFKNGHYVEGSIKTYEMWEKGVSMKPLCTVYFDENGKIKEAQ